MAARSWQSTHDHGKVCKIMAKYARSWQSMQDNGTVCNIMAKYARSWQSMQDHGKVCNIIAKYARSWQSMQYHGKVCKIMAKFARSWQRWTANITFPSLYKVSLLHYTSFFLCVCLLWHFLFNIGYQFSWPGY